MSGDSTLHLFDGYGIELEYMIVDRRSLSVFPVADEVLHAVAGDYVSEVEQGPLSWSNELVLHVIELKTNGPASTLGDLASIFSEHVERIRRIVHPLGGRLMPTAMHPWMDPARETVLWPHEYNPVYEAFDRIFGCQGHGWSNLQCVHINLPFANDVEFARLHAAIRVLLPIIPAIAASSPVIEGKITGYLDSRLHVYRDNAKEVPAVAGLIVPEAVFSREEYDQKILQQLYRAMASYDPEGILRYEWLNARGAIARFDRNAIEIRIVDIQECPLADIAIVHSIKTVLEALVSERWEHLAAQKTWDPEVLNRILLATTKDAERAEITDNRYLRALGYSKSTTCTAGELWRHLADTVIAGAPSEGVEWQRPIETILSEGTLARRILGAIGDSPSRAILHRLYEKLCDCLDTGSLFRAKD
jgi:carboxylate-amine ligase